MIARMIRKKGMDKSDMTLVNIPETEEPGNTTPCRLKPEEENVFTLAPVKKSGLDGQVNEGAGTPILVDEQTVFTSVEDHTGRSRIYLWSVMVALMIVAVVMPALYFLHTVSLPVTELMPAVTTLVEPDSAAMQTLETASGRRDETTDVSPDQSENASAAEKHNVIAENKNTSSGTETRITTIQTGPGDALQRDAESAVEAQINETAEVPARTTPAFMPPLTVTMDNLAAVPDTAKIIGYDTGNEKNGINIIRGQSPDRKQELINAAYAAYLSGRYAEAMQAYLDVLADMPDDREALLGVAAIAQRTGESDTAWQTYLKLLENFPDDPVAITGLISLRDERNYTGNTVVIKRLLHDHPHAAYLYFFLGTLHATAARWPEAQQAFAEACRLDVENPDYAYNLAVSLEHVGDHGSALDSYHVALELAHDRPVNFDSSAVARRIAVLSGISSGH